MALRLIIFLVALGQIGLIEARAQLAADKQPAPAGPGTTGAALIEAARQGDMAAARTALENGADVNTHDAGGRTPLIWAELAHSPQIVRMLVDRGADVKVRDSRGGTALVYASSVGEPEVVSMLLDKGADVDEGMPLASAIEFGNTETAELLLNRGANIRARGESRQTPLDIAAEYGRMGLVKTLLGHGADVNDRTAQEPRQGARNSARYSRRVATPLLWALWSGHNDIAQRLIDAGADVNGVDEAGDTPLHYAVMLGNIDSVHLLLVLHPDLNRKNNDGVTALGLAREHWRWEFAALLESNGATDPGRLTGNRWDPPPNRDDDRARR